MSLISKFTSLFGSSQTTQGPYSPSDPRLEEVLHYVMKPNTKFNIKGAAALTTIFLMEREEHLDSLFSFISQNINPSFRHTTPISVLQLLSTLHSLFMNQELQYEVAVKLKETKFSFFSEKDTQQQKKSDHTKLPLRPQDQRRMETEAHETPNQCRDNHLPTEGDQEKSFQLHDYTKLYHIYLQRIAANVDLYRAVSENLYPYMNAKDYVEPKLMFLWHYKIQNLLNTAIPLLLPFDQSIVEIQQQIWNDIFMFQQFLCKELQQIADSYATLPNADTLSLYEIFCDAQKHSKSLQKFVAQAEVILILETPPYPHIPQGILQDFLGFASKLKVLNQFTFKRGIKVPNKQNPCMGIPTHNPNLRHLRSTSGKFLVKQDKQISPDGPYQQSERIEMNLQEMEIDYEDSNKIDREQESEESQDQVESVMDEQKQQAKRKFNHNRGFSTFHQQ